MNSAAKDHQMERLPDHGVFFTSSRRNRGLRLLEVNTDYVEQN
jgi:hypothetical protein